MSALVNILSAALSRDPLSHLPRRSEIDWEECLQRWEQPASSSEEATIERAARMVRDALATNPWFATEGVLVEPQGSYFNNTNVRQQADMDLRVVHPALVVTRHPSAGNLSTAELYVSLPRTNQQIADELRGHVTRTLQMCFGQVIPGKKAVRISEVQGSRSDIDVVPVLTHHLIGLREEGDIGPVEGVFIFGTDGSETYNFPLQHHLRGKAKRERTGHRFKKMVRAVKSLRDEMVTHGVIGSKELPSFLIECLVYRVEDDFFVQNETRLPRLKRILSRIEQQLNDPTWIAAAREINDSKQLFMPAQPWDAQTVKACIQLCRLRISR